MSRALIQTKSELGPKIALLYFLNTIGAVIGTLAAGFFLIRTFGIFTSNYIAVFINCFVGFYFVLFSPRTSTYPVRLPAQEKSESRFHWIPAVYFILGAVAMSCEVAWSRSLHLVIGSTVYAFTMMLAAFLLGIALGSLACSRWIGKSKSPVQLMGGLVLLTGLLIAVSIATISRLPVILVNLFPAFHEPFALWQVVLFFLGALVVFPATFSMGATFPAVAQAYITRISNVGGNVGNLYLWNTFGGIIGVIFAGFITIPYLGTRSSLLLFAATFLIIGFSILLAVSKTRRTQVQLGVLLLMCLIIFFILPPWTPILLDSGAYLYAPQLQEGFDADRKILYENESLHAYITVTEKNGVRSLKINGKTDGSDGGYLTTQIMLAHLPILHSQHTENVLIIGLGTGVTLGSALTYPSVKAKCIEIDPAVVEASRFFNHVSGNPLADDRAEIIVADARTVLETTEQTFDVIISEPSNPWISGVSHLFTLEHFSAIKDKLNPEGIACQWIHSYYMDTPILSSILKTFGEVFPYCTLWGASRGDFLIIGSDHPVPSNREIINRRMQMHSVAVNLSKINVNGYTDLMRFKFLSTEQFDSLVKSSSFPLNTDDKAYVEFHAPQSLFQKTVEKNYSYIRSFTR